MKTLWTPWRIEHVRDTAPRMHRCLFEPPGNDASSKEELLLYRDADCLCLLNRYPYTNRHLLAAPVRHVSCITELSPDEMTPLMTLVRMASAILKKTLQPDGFNIGLNIGSEAGAGIADHLHFHIVPRWHGDHNFMTVLADVRAIPEHIEATYELLLPEFQTYYQSEKKSSK